jgi:hypothetical protein
MLIWIDGRLPTHSGHRSLADKTPPRAALYSHTGVASG